MEADVERPIRGFVSSWTETRWDILNVLCAGEVVIAERVDRTKAGATSVDLPCTGVFRLEGGKLWRGGFDMATHQRATA